MPWLTSVRSSASRPLSPAASWGLDVLLGRLCELSAVQPAVTLTPTLRLVRDAQQADETVAWVTTTHSTFFPLDMVAFGVDLHALVVVRAHRVEALGRAADHLARSGGFGLIVVDLGSIHPPTQVALNPPVDTPLPMPLQSRLLGLAQKHRAAVVFLSHKTDDSPSLSSLVSLRGSVQRHTQPRRRLDYEVTALKDKHCAPGWSHTDTVLAPARHKHAASTPHLQLLPTA